MCMFLRTLTDTHTHTNARPSPYSQIQNEWKGKTENLLLNQYDGKNVKNYFKKKRKKKKYYTK